MTAKASFIGLGSMGAPMAMNLLKGGVSLSVYNRSKEKATPLVKAGAKLLEHPSEAFSQAPLAFSMVANDQALEAISEDLLKGAKPGCIHISSSTVAPETTRKLLRKHEEKGVQFIAAPVFGRPDVAAKHELWICVAGDVEAKKRAEPLLRMMGKKVYDFGNSPESANAVKVAGNFTILSVVEMLGEALAFAEKSGVNPEQLHAFLTDSLYPSPVFDTYGKIINQKKFSPAGFKLTLGLKDLTLFLNAAKSVHTSTPLAQLLQKQLQTSVEKGREEMDWSAISLLAQEGS